MLDSKIYDFGHYQYLKAVGGDDEYRDEDGFIRLHPTASHVDKSVESLTTSIDDLESRLKVYRAEKEKAVKYQKTDEYKASKKEEKKKKKKKARNELLNMVFNSAPMEEEEPDEDEEEDKSKKGSKKKSGKTTLETQYGKRYAPIVKMLYDSISDFEQIAQDIDEELSSSKGQVRNMYRGQQVSNMLTAKNMKMSAIRELASIANKVTDIEYRREKDKRDKDGDDDTKGIAALGAQFLRGAFDDVDDDDDGKKGKKKHKGESNLKRQARKQGNKVDDDDDYSSSKSKKYRGKDTSDSDTDLAKVLASELLDRKGEYSFSAYERGLEVEGKYKFVIAVDPMNCEKTARFIAVDPKTDKAIPDFKKNYPDLFPKMKKTKMIYNTSKMMAYDKLSGKRWPLVFIN